ncbi:hypothetical protein JYS44_00280 [Phycisphaeraceae bacterium AH-315-B13]|nr:hypothetical protein [Phycisphaeraceae bacterium AH-315-B13]
MNQLRAISVESIPRAIAKAERYRLLNEPRCAESICRDILAVDAKNQDAIKILILAITDQFSSFADRMGVRERKEDVESLLSHLPDEYARRYYTGVMLERWGKGLLGVKCDSSTVLDMLERAMVEYEAADKLADPVNQDAVLRWNTCVRLIARYELKSKPQEPVIHLEAFDDEVPYR